MFCKPGQMTLVLMKPLMWNRWALPANRVSGAASPPQPHKPVTTFDTPLAPETNEIRAEAIESTHSLTDLQIPVGGILVKRL